MYRQGEALGLDQLNLTTALLPRQDRAIPEDSPSRSRGVGTAAGRGIPMDLAYQENDLLLRQGPDRETETGTGIGIGTAAEAEMSGIATGSADWGRTATETM